MVSPVGATLMVGLSPYPKSRPFVPASSAALSIAFNDVLLQSCCTLMGATGKEELPIAPFPVRHVEM